MHSSLSDQFSLLLNINLPKTDGIVFDAVNARKLCDRIDGIRLHAHTYSFIHNLTHGSFKPADALEFAYQHELHGLNIHVDDGGEHSLANKTPKELTQFKSYAQELKVAVHLETSSTQKREIDKVIHIARALEVKNIRVYSRYEGTLVSVMAQTVADLVYMAEQADMYDLFFDFEQHEEFKSIEIVEMLKEVNHLRINALFDFTNMLNAYEKPLPALKSMAPFIRQVHLKGARIIQEDKGYGQRGVVQGAPEDEMPYARMLYELLMLGEVEPQVISFALEQEVSYYAPAYRHADEGDNPFIPFKDPSETPFDKAGADRILLDERRWASNQVYFIRSLLAKMRWLAVSYLEN
ncbi:MAG: TIM barrel protein [Anaerolineae bacterium]|jgi:sugar phosphate isomerase/epimerase|nr:TIM barrel protein [Anaerolineae bacterium]MBT3713185.1 TIM barrel protein [Anaerolineae bacterium]MBT4310682.1 TIM barrel protein [Anaerolineae bacterium]MBT4457032.1 TIM barrel protein [Anaerolineae bacterium]MBT6061345.1 TIM barrel protein [Anaerolineae bacterium]